MNERIRLLRKSLNMTQEEFSSRIKLSRNFIAQIETGTKIPSDRTVSDICREFNINEQWLRNGIEPMKISQKGKLSAYVAEITHGDDYLIQDLIEIYMELDDNSKETLRIIADKLVEKRKGRE